MFDREADVEQVIKHHREVGDDKLADAFEYIINNKNEWDEGEIRPEDFPQYDYDTALYVLNCIWFGHQLNS